ncbi:CoA pyrophosphatase [uncultured Piscinibacter sp.]|uniref:CoA pyrophosphatase n=1 Tax=uncultured Piscinibacter sp. TaxID=1131835 RepID=UPI0026082B42|nr:CoA pyrophosphatase [uncultured Piscinibacter sp.]
MTRAPVLDPLSVPVIGTDAHLSAVPHERLQAPALRERFAAGLAWEPEITGDGRLFADREPAHASVLVPLVAHERGLTVLLTRRTDHLRDHAGQISFPGGRSEDSDDDAVHTALREAEEEVGLARAHVDVIGSLPVYTTVTGFIVTPVVALVRPGFLLALDRFEVAEAFEVPLPFLMDPAHHQRHEIEFGGVKRRFLSMPWDGPGADGQVRRYFIWGATAAMLRNLYAFLAR